MLHRQVTTTDIVTEAAAAAACARYERALRDGVALCELRQMSKMRRHRRRLGHNERQLTTLVGLVRCDDV